ncbi:MAG: type II toxin-antitoxin system Phd/YefM family antitoxin [Anaerolineales bacterium]|nr:type II toxin-antitoxin system Phd/YefM family antitoxin [Anaerolineales bacterium]
MTITKINSGDARIKWRDMLDQVYAGVTDIIIVRSGKDVAVLIPASDYEAVREDLDELRSARQAAATYAEWQRDPSVARPWEEVEAELTSKGLVDA